MSGSVLVSKVLSRDRSIEVTLKAKKKIKSINGTIWQPIDINPLFAVWERCNSMVISWILNSVSNDIVETILYARTTREMWEDLQN